MLGHVGLLVLFSVLRLPLGQPWGAQSLLGWPPWPSLETSCDIFGPLRPSPVMLSFPHPTPVLGPRLSLDLNSPAHLCLSWSAQGEAAWLCGGAPAC